MPRLTRSSSATCRDHPLFGRLPRRRRWRDAGGSSIKSHGRQDVRAVLRARRRAVPAHAGPALPLPVAEARRRPRTPEARPLGVERLRLHHGRRGHREDDAAARLPHRAHSRHRDGLRLQPRPLAARAAADDQRRIRPARRHREPHRAGRRAQPSPARPAAGGPPGDRRHRRGPGARGRGPGAAPAPLEPRDHHREAAAHHPRRAAPAAHAPAPPRARAAEPADHAPLAHRAAHAARDRGVHRAPPGDREPGPGRPHLHTAGAAADPSTLGRGSAPDQHDRASRHGRGLRRRPPDGPATLRPPGVQRDRGRAAPSAPAPADEAPRDVAVAPDAALVATAPPATIAPPPAPPGDSGASLSDTTAMEQRLRALDTRSSAHEALDAVFTAWSVRTLGPRRPADAGAFTGAAMRRGLEHLLVSSNGSLLRALDLPAVLELNVPGADGVRYATVVGLSTAGATFVVGDASIPVDRAFLDRAWFGRAHVFWRDFDAIGSVTREPSGGVRRLQGLLRRTGTYHGPETGLFDGATRGAVLEFQRNRFLVADGHPGPLTRIMLYDIAGYPRPTLGSTGGGTS